MIEWWMIVGALGYTAVIADAGYEWGRRRGRKEGERRVLEHPRPADALWVRSTRPRQARVGNVTRSAAEEPSEASRVSKARVRRPRKRF